MKVHYIDNSGDFYKLVKDLPIRVGFDIETSGLNSQATLLGFSVGTENEGWYYDVEMNGLPRKGLELLFSEHELIMHNGKFDIYHLYRLGFDKINYKYDSMYLIHLLDSEIKMSNLQLKKIIKNIIKKDTIKYKEVVDNAIIDGDIDIKKFIKIIEGSKGFILAGGDNNKFIYDNFIKFVKYDEDKIIKKLNDLIKKEKWYELPLYDKLADDEMKIVKQRVIDKDSVNQRANFLFLKKLFDGVIVDNYYKRFCEYGALDAIYTVIVYNEYMKKIPDDWRESVLRLLYEDVELAKVVARMELKGFRFNEEMVLQKKSEYEKRVYDITKKIYQMVGKEFNLNSVPQLLEVLREYGLDISATNEKVLSEYANNELVRLILELREYNKILSTYIDGFLKKRSSDGCIRSSYNLVMTPTFRFAASGFYKEEGVNIQNIPEDMRDIIVADEGKYFLSGDYSGQEVRLLLGFIGNKEIIEKVNNGYDMHCLTASMMFGIPYEDIYDSYNKANTGQEGYNKEYVKLRKMAKAITFGLIYGLGFYSLANRLSYEPNKKEWDGKGDYNEWVKNKKREYGKKMAYKFYNGVKGLLDFKSAVQNFYYSKGYVQDYFGRRRYIRRDGHEATKILNSVIQGSAASMVRKVMLKLDKALKESRYKDKVKMAINMHDELVFEVDDSVPYNEVVEFLRSVMEVEVMGVKFYTDWAYGKSWGSLIPIDVKRDYKKVVDGGENIKIKEPAILVYLKNNIKEFQEFIKGLLVDSGVFVYLYWDGDIYEVGYIEDIEKLKLELFRKNFDCEVYKR